MNTTKPLTDSEKLDLLIATVNKQGEAIEGLVKAFSNAKDVEGGIVEKPESEPAPQAISGVYPSKDFRWVKVHGKTYTFTKLQAPIIKHLFKQYPDEVSDGALLEMFGCGRFLKDSFRGSSAWRTLLVQGSTRGTRKLNLDPQNSSPELTVKEKTRPKAKAKPKSSSPRNTQMLHSPVSTLFETLPVVNQRGESLTVKKVLKRKGEVKK